MPPKHHFVYSLATIMLTLTIQTNGEDVIYKAYDGPAQSADKIAFLSWRRSDLEITKIDGHLPGKNWDGTLRKGCKFRHIKSRKICDARTWRWQKANCHYTKPHDIASSCKDKVYALQLLPGTHNISFLSRNTRGWAIANSPGASNHQMCNPGVGCVVQTPDNQTIMCTPAVGCFFQRDFTIEAGKKYQAEFSSNTTAKIVPGHYPLPGEVTTTTTFYEASVEIVEIK